MIMQDHMSIRYVHVTMIAVTISGVALASLCDVV